MDSKRVSVICPVYNEEDQIVPFVDAVRSVLDIQPVTFEILFVDDGSSDNTWDVIANVARGDSRVTGIRLAKNVGKEAALTAGLASATGNAHIPMDVDLQDPPEVLPQMIRLWLDGAKHVVARRADRDDGFLRDALSKGFFSALNWLSFGQIPRNVGDYRLLDGELTQNFLKFPEKRRVNKALFALLGATPVEVQYARPKSARRGEPRQSTRKLVDLVVVSASSYSDRFALATLKVALVALGMFFPLAMGITFFWLAGVIAIPGQATVLMVGLVIACLITIFGSLNLLIASEVLSEVKRRPLYIVEDRLLPR